MEIHCSSYENFAMILSMKVLPEIPYLSAEGLSRPIPLERFLPDCPVGVIGQFLAGSTGQEEWLLDPFGSNPLLDIEAAASGKRILVTENNPILAFMLDLLAEPREKDLYLSALAEFASLLRGNERLETHIRTLYHTRCAVCHQDIQAEGYLWQRGQEQPYAKIYHCPFCGEEGEHPITDDDIQVLEPLIRGEKLPRARALGRVLLGNEDERPAVEEAMKLYNPRSLYVLFTLLNKLEGMEISTEKRTLLDAMMISSLDAGTSLWSWPNNGEPPHQLTLPQVYLEKNIWLELEKSIDLWSQPAQPVELTVWPETPKTNGICLFKGPIRAFSLQEKLKIGEIVCIPPRPNQAFWTLSALWSAWLWGRDSETRFGQVLGRRRFDWHWHTNALYGAFKKAADLMSPSSVMFTGIGELSPGMVLAVCAAARGSGFGLEGIAWKSTVDPVQIVWKKANEKGTPQPANIQSLARTAIQDILTRLGESADYLALFTAVVASLTMNNGLPAEIANFSQEKSAQLQGIVARLFNDRDFLQRFDATSQELDSGKWGLVNRPENSIPLADRVEKAMAELLQKKEPMKMQAIEKSLAEKFPGLLTPPEAVVEFCLKSYAEYELTTDTWRLKEQETTDLRNRDLENALELLRSLAKRMGFHCSGSAPLIWQKEGETDYHFFVTDLACLAEFCESGDAGIQNVLVLPGSRAELLKYKLLRDGQLRAAVAPNWHFLKLRSLRNLAARMDMSPTIWLMLLDSDPITLEESTQLRIFG